MVETIGIIVYLIIAIAVLVAIRIEADKQGIAFNWIQFVISLGWIIWGFVYIVSLFKRKDNARVAQG